jgi:hypothetical protein
VYRDSFPFYIFDHKEAKGVDAYVNKQTRQERNTRKAMQQMEVVHITAVAPTSCKELTVPTAVDILYSWSTK